MKVVGLVSGGKDSCYNMMLCQSYGHEIVALANLLPLDNAVDELDSFMYQTVGHQVVAAFAQCMGLPLFRRRIQGSPRAKELRYSETEGDEVEDLDVLLREVKSQFPEVGGVSTGAIASDYQRLRVENVCSRLGLVSLAFMWRQEQSSLLQNMIDSGLHAILVKVAAMGLDPHKHLGKDLAILQPLFLKLQDQYGCNVCGEGGEYESLTLDCPLFKNAKIVLDEFTVELHSPDTIAPVGVLHPGKFHLESKTFSQEPSSTSTVVEVTSDFMPVKYGRSETLPGIPKVSISCRDLECQEANIQPELLTAVIRQRHGFVAMSCWQQAGLPLQEVQCELGLLLGEVGRRLQIEELSWGDVLYIHLYLQDMADFTKANQMYVRHITEKDSVQGVPSRCCVELSLGQANMGHVAVEILAVRDKSKKVLHVQSISCWAPSCIGPYSQATQHQQLIYMAGQIGLDPPTMSLVPGGAPCEMVQAIKNCEAVAEVFTPRFLDSVLSFIIYCSSAASKKGMQDAGEVLESFLSKHKDVVTNSQYIELPAPLILYMLVPALPKGALVEVAPLIHSGSFNGNYTNSDDEFDPSWQPISLLSYTSGTSGVQEYWLCKGLILPRLLCRAISFLSSSQASTREATVPEISLTGKVSLGHAFQLLSNVLVKTSLGWADVFVLRVYFVVDKVVAGDLRKAVLIALEDTTLSGAPLPTLIPVLGVGETAELQDLIAVELTASGKC